MLSLELCNWRYLSHALINRACKLLKVLNLRLHGSNCSTVYCSKRFALVSTIDIAYDYIIIIDNSRSLILNRS